MEHKQIKFSLHKNNAGYSDCDGVLLFCGEWQYNLEVIPNKYRFICKKCKEALVSDAEETSLYVSGVIVQQKLNI